MEVPGGKENKGLVCLYEFLGTAGLLMAVNWCSGVHGVASMLFVLLYCFGSISGGHFNPAVTAAVLVREMFDDKNAGRKFELIIFSIMIVISQLLGGWFAIGLVTIGRVTNSESSVVFPSNRLCPGSWGSSQTSASIGATEAQAISLQNVQFDTTKYDWVQCKATNLYFELIYTEVCATFMFVFFIMCVKYHNDCSVDLHNCFAIGIALYACGTFASKLSGGCLNPAVALIQQAYQYQEPTNIGDLGVVTDISIINKLSSDIHKVGVSAEGMAPYFFGTLMGGVLAGLLSHFRNFSSKTLEASAREEEMNGQIN